jgi:hypothetical protein
MTRTRLAMLGLMLLAVALVGCGDDDGGMVPGTGTGTGGGTDGTVTGTVTRAGNGAPVEGAGIALFDPETLIAAAETAVSDAAGSYAIDGVAAGSYSVLIFTDSLLVFARTAPTVAVTAGDTATYDVRLIASVLWDGLGTRIEGTVVDDASGQPLAGALVETAIWGFDAADVEQLMLGHAQPDWDLTDDQGRFSITGVTVTDLGGAMVGLLPVSACRDGYACGSLIGTVEDPIGLFGGLLPLPPAGEPGLEVELRLAPLAARPPSTRGAVRGRVTDRAGAPLADIRVGLSLIVVADPDTLHELPAPVPVQGRTTLTAADGTFQIDDVTPGDYAVAAAYAIGDGLVQLGREVDQVAVAAGDTADAGDVRLGAASTPLAPAPGDSVTSIIPLLRWTRVPGATGYRLSYGIGHLLETRVDGIVDTTFQTFMPFPPGSGVRWFVEARNDQGQIGGFEEAASFTVTATAGR